MQYEIEDDNMPPTQPIRRRRSRFGLTAMVLTSLAILGGGIVVTLWAMDVPLAFWRQHSETNPYLVRIPINVRAIPAYSKVSRSDLIDATTKRIKYQELSPNSVIKMAISGISLKGVAAKGKVLEVHKHHGQLMFVLDSGEEIPHAQVDQLGGALMNVSTIVGRVLKKSKSPGLGFREGSFFPQGTPEGVAGATPPGMRAMILDASGLQGVYALPAGARVDLMANIPFSELSSFEGGHRTRLSGGLSIRLSSKEKSDRDNMTEPIMLAQEALVLKPVYQRDEATPSSSGASSQRSKRAPVYEVALAVQPEDVIPLQTALNKELEVTCVAHSMQRSEETAAQTARRPTGLVAPVTSRTILAYEVISQDYFEDVATRQVHHEMVTAEEIDRLKVITSLDQLVGAVVKHDIPRGSFITQNDLLQPARSKSGPKKDFDQKSQDDTTVRADSNIHLARHRETTSQVSQAKWLEDSGADRRRPRANIVGEAPGISTFVPPGHMAVAIPWSRLYGAEHLKVGDVVDLTVSYSLQYEAESKEQERKPDGTVIERTIKRRANEPTKRTYDETLGFRGEPWFAALKAKVIGPVGYPPPTAATRFLGESLFELKQGGESAGPPILFAIEERDQEAISAAMATKDATFAVTIHPPKSDTSTPAGWKRIVLAPVGIPALDKLTNNDLEQRHTRRLLTRLVRTDDPVFEHALTEAELRPLLGCVLRSYKNRHTFFTKKDFFASDVQPGFAAGIDGASTVYIADNEDIEGLEHFRDNDRIAILFRAIAKKPEGVITHGLSLERPVASVVVPEARILRASQEGKTVLEVSQKDVTRLHAAWAAAFAKKNDQNDENKNRRLHLVAISLPTSVGADSGDTPAPQTTDAKIASGQSSFIPDFDPAAETRVLEVIVGDRRETHVFANDRAAVVAPSYASEK